MDKVKILIVDDNESFLEVLNEHLLYNNYDVVSCLNAVDAKDIFVKFEPNIVITDIVMPDVDGIELLASLREINPNIQVIAMSGGNKGHGDMYLQLADKLGANTILNKPFHLSVLLVEIEKLLVPL